MILAQLIRFASLAVGYAPTRRFAVRALIFDPR